MLVPRSKIDSIAFDILKQSGALGSYPTPTNQIIQYCELSLDRKENFHATAQRYVAKNVDAFERMLKKVLGVFDREEKAISVDPNLPTSKKNFVKLHELGHYALPWQKDINYLDDDTTISPDVKVHFEAEANYFASTTLFQTDRFSDELDQLPLEIGTPMFLAKKYGSSNHAALRRYAECCTKRCALFVLEKEKSGGIHSLQLKNIFQSKSFTQSFGSLALPDVLDLTFPFVLDFIRGKKFHKDGFVTFKTVNGFQEFEYHYFNNQYNVFVLVMPAGEKNRSTTTIVVSS